MEIVVPVEELLAVFGTYNLAIWPLQLIAYLLGFLAVFLSFRRTKHSSRIIAAILSFYWLWTGVVFCVLFWGPNYTLAYGFAVMGMIQGVVFLVLGVLKPRLSFRFQPDVYGVVGILLVAYAMLGYPVFGYFLGHIYPRTMPFGLVPCPTTVFTLGLLLWTDKPVPKYFLIVPFMAGVSGLLAVWIGVLEDVGLIVAGLVGTGLILYRDTRRPVEEREALTVAQPSP
jgi:hypothetical protein